MAGYHKPVLLREAIEALDVEKGKWYLDCTLGDGGHTLEILKQGGKVVGIDVDPQALNRAGERLRGLGEYKLIQGNFRDIKNLLQQTELKNLEFAGAIFDLGVSSLQLESSERGFSFAKEGPLDMRMDPNLQVKALDLVNGLNKGELYVLFNRLGEEKYSRSLAEAVVSARALRPIHTTKELSEVVIRVLGGVRGKIHPATRVFQALRVAVNDELNALKMGLGQVKNLIAKNGLIVVISFHSLEDRIAKLSFREWEDGGWGKELSKKPIMPSAKEISQNSRSRSAKMRVFRL